MDSEVRLHVGKVLGTLLIPYFIQPRFTRQNKDKKIKKKKKKKKLKKVQNHEFQDQNG